MDKARILTRMAGTLPRATDVVGELEHDARSGLFDGRDDADGAGLLEEERDDNDLAAFELARQLREGDAFPAGVEPYEARTRDVQPRQRLTALAQDLCALGDRGLHPHEDVLEHARAGDVHEEERAVAVAHHAAALGQETDAADVRHGRIVDATAQEQAQREADRAPPEGAASAAGRHAPLNAPSATIARKARS